MIPFAILIAMLVCTDLIIRSGRRKERVIADARWKAWGALAGADAVALTRNQIPGDNAIH